jgi:hypothetical protein
MRIDPIVFKNNPLEVPPIKEIESPKIKKKKQDSKKQNFKDEFQEAVDKIKKHSNRKINKYASSNNKGENQMKNQRDERIEEMNRIFAVSNIEHLFALAAKKKDDDEEEEDTWREEKDPTELEDEDVVIEDEEENPVDTLAIDADKETGTADPVDGKGAFDEADHFSRMQERLETIKRLLNKRKKKEEGKPVEHGPESSLETILNETPEETKKRLEEQGLTVKPKRDENAIEEMEKWKKERLDAFDAKVKREKETGVVEEPKDEFDDSIFEETETAEDEDVSGKKKRQEVNIQSNLLPIEEVIELAIGEGVLEDADDAVTNESKDKLKETLDEIYDLLKENAKISKRHKSEESKGKHLAHLDEVLAEEKKKIEAQVDKEDVCQYLLAYYRRQLRSLRMEEDRALLMSIDADKKTKKTEEETEPPKEEEPKEEE